MAISADMLAYARLTATDTMVDTFQIQAPTLASNGFGETPTYSTVSTTIGKMAPLSATEVPMQYATMGRKLFYFIYPPTVTIRDDYQIIGPDGTIFTILGGETPRTGQPVVYQVYVSCPSIA